MKTKARFTHFVQFVAMQKARRISLSEP